MAQDDHSGTELAAGGAITIDRDPGPVSDEVTVGAARAVTNRSSRMAS